MSTICEMGLRIIGLTLLTAALWGAEPPESGRPVSETELPQPSSSATGDVSRAVSAARPADAPTPRREALNEAVIRELERIRRQLGMNPLRGSILDEIPLPDESGNRQRSEFAQQLRDGYGTSVPPVPPTNASASSAAELAAREYRRRSLRSLGRRLDAIAHDMDELELYDEASRVRALSQSLRSSARP